LSTGRESVLRFSAEFRDIFAEPRIRPSRSLGIDTKLPLRVRFYQRGTVWRVAPVLPVLAVPIRNSADGRPTLVSPAHCDLRPIPPPPEPSVFTNLKNISRFPELLPNHDYPGPQRTQ
jgi:hypothetical protein